MTTPTDPIRALRVDLAAAFRLAAQFDWHDSVGNHFSVALPDTPSRFLLNPRWSHFATLRASDLLVVDALDPGTMARPDAPDPTAWCIHGRIHARVPAARCILHVHPPYATALCALEDPTLAPIDQVTARFHGRVAIDRQFNGLADDAAEGDRLAALLGEHRVLLMANHGVLVTGATIAEAFESLYLLERAARTLVLAYSTGQPLRILSPALAERTARDWEDYAGMAPAHFEALRGLLDRQGADYAT
jgi:ribulose-5-phosphate 4-epimerase/fuculose-1-phosphate aldolase